MNYMVTNLFIITALILFGCSSDPIIDQKETEEEIIGESPDDAEEEEDGEDEEEYVDLALVIKPYAENPRYWQYLNEPVLLLGATNNDNLFQSADMKEQLDLLSNVGGNYIRNTMSSRDYGDLWPFFQQDDGMYDLDLWNQEYWDKFEELLTLTEERDIIVQIEVWDRFDFSQDPWLKNPFNPKNNVNYSTTESGLKEDYPDHPGGDSQLFFHSINGMDKYKSELEIVKKYQENFFKKLYSYTKNYGHILYCINNETNTPPQWGKYWLSYLNSLANNHEVYATDMFDHFKEPQGCDVCILAISEPDIYTFLDASQVNWNVNQEHWDSISWVFDEREKYSPRPVNSVKVYGILDGAGVNHGVERFCRDVLIGYASARFHRPDLGNGQNDHAIAAIKAVRKIESVVNFWDIFAHQELLGDRESNEAYLAADEGDDYVLLFPRNGKVKLDLSSYSKKFFGRWVGISTGEWGNKFEVEGGTNVDLSPPDSNGWFAIIVDQDDF